MVGVQGLSRSTLVQTGSLVAIDYGRLIILEARAAQSEARIATQDQLIFSLQQRVAKMEQILSTISREGK